MAKLSHFFSDNSQVLVKLLSLQCKVLCSLHQSNVRIIAFFRACPVGEMFVGQQALSVQIFQLCPLFKKPLIFTAKCQSWLVSKLTIFVL